MFKLIYRQRRRIVFSATFFTLAISMVVFRMIRSEGTLDMLYSNGPLLGTATLIITFLVVLTGAAITIGVAIVLIPRLRNLWEVLAGFSVIVTAVHLTFPWLGDLPVIGPFWPMILYFGIYGLLYSSFLDRYPLFVDTTSTRSFVVDAPPRAVWPLLVATPGQEAAHWDPLLHKVDVDPDDPSVFKATYHHGNSLFQMQTQTVLESDYPRHHRYAHVGDVSDKNKAYTEGTYDIRLDPVGTPEDEATKTKVTLQSQYRAIRPMQGCFMWFDDTLGSDVDTIRAQISGKSDWSTSGLYRRLVGAVS